LTLFQSVVLTTYTVRRHVEVDTGVVDVVPECSTDDVHRTMRCHVEVDTDVVDVVP